MVLGVIFDSPRALHSLDKAFDGKSAVEVCSCVMESVCDKVVTVSLPAGGDSTLLALTALSKAVEGAGTFDAVLFTFSDTPLLSASLAKKILAAHKSFGADYTEGLGFCEGVAPVALKSSLFKILVQLLKSGGKYEKLSAAPFVQGSVYSVLEVDINTYEIEDVISNEDFRLARLTLDCHDKAAFCSCIELWKECCEKGVDIKKAEAEDICRVGVNSSLVMKTLPNFYQIEIADKNGNKMSLEDFAVIAKKIATFSESAIVSLCVEGEPLQNSNFLSMAKKLFEYPGLKLLIETSGEELTEDLCQALKTITKAAPPRIGNDEYFFDLCWVIKGGKNAEIASKYFPDALYAKYTRHKGDEVELEKFYRKWSAPDSPTYGRVTIDQCSTHCGTRSEGKVVDLSPLQKRYCYHARRDFVVLTNGDVPYCEFCEKKIVGNILRDEIDKLFYANKSAIISDDVVGGCCNECDEYYTFNF